MGYEAMMGARDDYVSESARDLFLTGAFEEEIIERILEGEYDSVILKRLKALFNIQKIYV